MTAMKSRPANPEAVKTAEAVARDIFRSDPATRRRDVRRWLFGAVWAFIIVPPLFWLRFGEVGPVGWGTSVFFSVFCILTAVGLHFLRRPEYHTPVRVQFGWADKIGAFWLVACGLGPFVGWMVSGFASSLGNWQWFYGARVVFAIGLPVLTALPLLRYVRGRGAPVMLAILVGVTALPVWSGWSTLQDLRSGPVSDKWGSRWHLLHTDRWVKR